MRSLSRAARDSTRNGPYFVVADGKDFRVVRGSMGLGDPRTVAEQMRLPSAIRVTAELNRAWSEDPSRLD